MADVTVSSPATAISRWACVAWVAVFMARPIVWPGYGHNREYAWGPMGHLVGNAYLLAAFALCIWAVVEGDRTTGPSTTSASARARLASRGGREEDDG